MIEIVNLENLLPQAMLMTLDQKAVKGIMRNVMDGAFAYWVQLAGQTFHSTKAQYIRGIQAVRWISDDVAVISLVGVLPNILEQGMEGRDLHETLLGPNVPEVPLGQKGKHPSADGGSYRAIPFSHQTPGAGAHGTPMGKVHMAMMGKKGAMQMGRAVYREAKKLAPTKTDPYSGKTQWGGRLDTSKIKARGEKMWNVPKLKSYHATDPYAGMVRKEKTYESATQSTYSTFRTIAVDAGGNPKGSSPWFRRGTEGKFLVTQVAHHLTTRLAPEAFGAYVAGLKL